MINFGVIWVTLGHNWHRGGTPQHPWDCQGVPGWNFDQFFLILGSPFGAIGDPLVVTFGSPVHQVRQIKVKNVVKWPSMQRIWQKLAFRMGSCCPRAGFYAKYVVNMHVLARCQHCNFGTKSGPRNTPKLVFRSPFGDLGSSLGSFGRLSGFPKPI